MDVQWYTDVADDALTTFLKKTPEALKAYNDAAASTLKPENATGDGIPADLLQQFERFEGEQYAFHYALGEVKTYVGMRIPQIKDEDNSGVHIQEVVIGLINKIRSGQGAKGDDSGPELSVQSKLDYVSSRSKVEKTIADNKEPKEEKKDDKEKDKEDKTTKEEKEKKEAEAKEAREAREKLNTLYKLQLKEMDRQAYLKLRLGWQNLAYQRATVYNTIKLNREKIDNPRRKEYGMSL